MRIYLAFCTLREHEHMNAKHPIILAGSFVLILAAVVCTFGALISAFSFDVDAGALLITWTITALILSVLATLRRGKGILALTPLVALTLLWKLPGIVNGAKWVIFYISREFNKWLVVSILFPGAKASDYEVTLFFAIAGVVLAFFLTAAICLRRSSFFVVFLTSPIVFVTFVLLHSQPDVGFLIGLLAVYLTLLISGALHPDDYTKRGKTIFPALALALLLLGLTYVVASPEGYKREIRLNSIDSSLRNVASRIGLARIKYGIGWPRITVNEWHFDTNSAEISNAGTRIITDQDVLEVTSTIAGTFYLKGFSLEYFDGQRWTAGSKPNSEITNKNINELFASYNPARIAVSYMNANPDGAAMDVKLAQMEIERTRDTTNTDYVPYYTVFDYYIPGYGQVDMDFFLPEGRLGGNYYIATGGRNNFLYTNDSIIQMARTLPHTDNFVQDAINTYIERNREVYTQIETSTAEGLRMLASEAGIDATAERGDIADQVARYIRSSGRYTLSPYVIPDDEDFTLYFLRESQQGYCIHFATAATMMLRALGIPARFTCGFAVSIPQNSVGKPYPVTDRNAHAWVEVFYDEIGWLPLEVTPASTGSAITGTGPYTSVNAPAPTRNPSGGAPSPSRQPMPDRPPQTTGSNQQTDKTADAGETPGNNWIVITIIVILSVAAAYALAMTIRRPIARIRRAKLFAQKDTNAAVICAWRYIAVLCRGKQRPSEDIEELAFKARYSQHTISEEERATVINYTTALYDELYYIGKPKDKILLFIRGL